jgi:hypothetical protein
VVYFELVSDRKKLQALFCWPILVAFCVKRRHFFLQTGTLPSPFAFNFSLP